MALPFLVVWWSDTFFFSLFIYILISLINSSSLVIYILIPLFYEGRFLIVYEAGVKVYRGGGQRWPPRMPPAGDSDLPIQDAQHFLVTQKQIVLPTWLRSKVESRPYPSD